MRGTGCRSEARTRHSFVAHVRTPGATRVEPSSAGRSAAEERILKVRDHFVAALMDYEAADRRKLADFVLDQCCVVQVTATDIDQAHRMFEVLNARGKPLARNDILKAELLSGVPAAIGSGRQGDLGKGRRVAPALTSSSSSAISAPCTGGATTR